MGNVEYDEFGLFGENAAEFGLPYDAPPVVRRESVEVRSGHRLSALVWGDGEPELVLLHGGQVQARLVRPREPAAISTALQALQVLPSANGPVDSLNTLLARQLARHPDATAFTEVDPDTAAERRLSLRQFDDLVGRAAAWLQARGVVAGDTVALWLVNRLDWLVLHFALARLGAAVMTVNTRYRGAEVAHLLERSRPRLLVLQLHFRRIDFAAVLQELDPASAASVAKRCVSSTDTRLASRELIHTASPRGVNSMCSTALPGSVTAAMRLPWRTKSCTPSSSSSSRICFDKAGCEVNSTSAAAVRFRPRRTVSRSARSCWKFTPCRRSVCPRYAA